MDFYLTEKLTGSSLALSMLPEQLEHKSGASFARYNIIKIGPVEVQWAVDVLMERPAAEAQHERDGLREGVALAATGAGRKDHTGVAGVWDHP